MSSLWLFLTVSVTHLDPINVGSLAITGHMMITSQLWSLVSAHTLSTVACGDVFTVAVSSVTLDPWSLVSAPTHYPLLLVAMSSLWLFLTVSVTHLDPINVGSLAISSHRMIASQLWSLV